MALSTKIKVTLPTSGIIVRRDGKHNYVYKVLRTYRNEKGQPTNDRRLIGRLDEESGMLIPNDTYFQFYEYDDSAMVEVLPCIDAVRSIGSSYLIGRILESLGIPAMLRGVFGDSRANKLITASSFMACQGNVMEGILDWCKDHTMLSEALSDQVASSLFASITHEEKMAFFRAWTACLKTPAYLSYDVTSFSTYAKAIGEAEWGYNRDGDKLPQINLGLYMGQKSGLPVFYTCYGGSIVDKSHLPYMMAYNQELGISDVTFIMDKGFCTQANIIYMHENHYAYIMGVEIRHAGTAQAILAVRDDICSMRKRIRAGIYADSIRSTFYGVNTCMHIYFDPLLGERQRADLYREVEAQEEILVQLELLSKRQFRHYLAYFDIDRKQDGSFTFVRSYTKIDEAARSAGFFCLLSSTTLSANQVLSAYRGKDMIEKGFDNLKNHIDMKRLHTRNMETTEGKLFTAFIALIAIAQIEANLGEYMREKSMSKDALIKELDRVKVIYTSNNKRLMNPLTKTQRSILASFGISEDDLKAYVAG